MIYKLEKYTDYNQGLLHALRKCSHLGTEMQQLLTAHSDRKWSLLKSKVMCNIGSSMFCARLEFGQEILVNNPALARVPWTFEKDIHIVIHDSFWFYNLCFSSYLKDGTSGHKVPSVVSCWGFVYNLQSAAALQHQIFFFVGRRGRREKGGLPINYCPSTILLGWSQSEGKITKL